MKIIIDSRERRDLAQKEVGKIKGSDNMEVVIQPHIDSFTGEMRAYFHILCRTLSDDTGFSAGEVKQLIKRKILGARRIKIGKTAGEVISSSEVGDDGKRRDKEDYGLLIEGAHELGAEAGIQLPAPIYKER